LYDGKVNVAHKGSHTTKISHASLTELVDFFRKANYFSLRDRHVSGITDNPAYETSISFDGVSKSVLDYVGQSVGMPSTVADVEAAIDRLAGPPNGSDAREPSKFKLIWFSVDNSWLTR
jgi:uncharacterized protein DUF6438